jgi:guanylate kinase
LPRRVRNDEMSKGTLFVLSGPSGVGKNTLLSGVLAQIGNIRKSVSATTRAPREGEVEGVNYYYLSQAEFAKRRGNDEFVETDEHHGNWYGTLKSEIADSLEKEIDIVLEIDVTGASNVKKIFADAKLIYVTLSGGIEELKNRLLGRGSEDEATISKRLERVEYENEQIGTYDKIIFNDILEDSIDELKGYILSLRK